MRNIAVWITLIIFAIVMVLAFAYYRITDSVVNPLAFAITLFVIFLIVLSIILSLIRNPSR